jgi:hypothetical protein
MYHGEESNDASNIPVGSRAANKKNTTQHGGVLLHHTNVAKDDKGGGYKAMDTTRTGRWNSSGGGLF